MEENRFEENIISDDVFEYEEFEENTAEEKKNNTEIPQDFCHLHLHTDYSLLDGFSRIDRLVEKLKKEKMTSCAITDHGNMFGAVEFYKKCRQNNIKPIIGCEVYVAPRKLTDKDSQRDSYYHHLILLAENNEGYKNLIKIVSKAYIDGFYYKPRTDKEELRKHSKGIICLTACLSGEVQKLILNGNYDAAVDTALEFRDIFGEDNFFLEMQNHGLEEDEKVLLGLKKISEQTGIPLVATNDVHYIEKEDAEMQSILKCIQKQTKVDELEDKNFANNMLYLKNAEEMRQLFWETPEALENTVKIAQRCNVEFEFNKYHIPEFEVPEGYTKYDYFRKLCFDGLKERYEYPTDEMIERLEYEIKVISDMGYIEYFLIVWDFINYAKQNDIMVGPGRGSAAGSIVAYTLKITDIDPIKYNLIFERFLNPERISMPDIDIDFCYERREEVIDYVKMKYGKDHVAQIITFGTLGARLAIRDIGRVLNKPYNMVDSIAKEIPTDLNMTIEKALQVNPQLKKMYDEDSDVKEVIDKSKNIEGVIRHASTHAAGVVIAKNPVDEYVPLYKNQDSITTQFTMTTLEELGLLKMDFLGLRTLTVIRDTLDLIEFNREKMGYTEKIDFSKMDYDDPEVFNLISQGNTMGIFQLESGGMRNFMKKLKPNNFEDIVAGISLFRPGPMDSIDSYIENKNNPEKIEYDDEKLKPILDVTYGCLVYQEQVMQVVRDLAGYSYGRSDLVRRAMSKKKMDVMEEERNYFIHGKYDDEGNIEIPGCVRNGVKEETANKIFDNMIDFAKYAFNKSHAAAYGVLAYETAYLKTHYPVEFMAALMTSIMGRTDKVVEYIKGCESMGIEVLPPDINKSFSKFSVDGDKIRFGLVAIKNLGESVIDSIVEEREKNGEFTSFMDFAGRIDQKSANKKTIEALIKSGALDCLGENRATLMHNFEAVLDYLNRVNSKNLDGQISLFDFSEDESLVEEYSMKPSKDFSDKVRLEMEKESVGMYITGHPLKEYDEIIKKKTSIDNSIINKAGEEKCLDSLDGEKCIMSGLITGKRVLSTKHNQLMCILQMEDYYGVIEVIVFPKTYEKYQSILKENSIILVKGSIKVKSNDEVSLISEDIKSIEDDTPFETRNPKRMRSNGTGKKVFLRIDSMENKELFSKIQETALRRQGTDRIILFPLDENKDSEKKKTYTLTNLGVYADDELRNMLLEFMKDEDIIIK